MSEPSIPEQHRDDVRLLAERVMSYYVSTIATEAAQRLLAACGPVPRVFTDDEVRRTTQVFNLPPLVALARLRDADARGWDAVPRRKEADR